MFVYEKKLQYPVKIKNNSADGWEDQSVGGGILLANLNDAAKVQIKNAFV